MISKSTPQSTVSSTTETKMTGDELERQCYIDAIVRLLGKATLHKVSLVWTYASHLIK